jgi:hypothetical protein
MSWTTQLGLKFAMILVVLATAAGLALPAAVPASASSLPKTQTSGFANWNSGGASVPP